MEGDLNRFGGDGEAAADGFEEGLFERPDFVEGSLASGVGQGVKAIVLGGREDAAGEILDGSFVADVFDVNANAGVGREGEQRVIARVRDVELNAFDSGFAEFVFRE